MVRWVRAFARSAQASSWTWKSSSEQKRRPGSKFLPGWVLTLVDIVIGVGSPAEGCDPQGDPSRC